MGPVFFPSRQVSPVDPEQPIEVASEAKVPAGKRFGDFAHHSVSVKNLHSAIKEVCI